MLREYVPITILTCLVKYQPFYTKHMPFSENKSILLQTPGGAGAGGGVGGAYISKFFLFPNTERSVMLPKCQQVSVCTNMGPPSCPRPQPACSV